MKWGLTTLIAHRYSLEHCFREAAALGFQYVELNCVRGYYAHIMVDLYHNQEDRRANL